MPAGPHFLEFAFCGGLGVVSQSRRYFPSGQSGAVHSLFEGSRLGSKVALKVPMPLDNSPDQSLIASEQRSWSNYIEEIDVAHVGSFMITTEPRTFHLATS